MKKYLIISLILTLLILALNMSLNTLINYTDAQWDDALVLHQNELPFSLRPMTSGAITVLQNLFPFSIRTAFIVHQYTLLFLLLFSFAFYLESLSFERRMVIWGLLMLAFSYPILCIHFIPNFSWDDIWAYIGLTWMSYFFFKDRYLLSAVCLAFAVINRENVLVILPLFYFYREEKKISFPQLLLLISPALLYIIYRGILFPEFLPGRFSRLLVNFGDIGEVRQSLYSLFISFGCLWVASLALGNRAGRSLYSKGRIFNINFQKTALVSSFLGVLLVLVAALARETRLFYSPFIFLIPLALQKTTGLFEKEIIYRNYRYFLAMVLFFAIFIVVSIFLFPTFNYLPMIDFHRVLFAIHATMIIMLIYSYRKTRSEK